MLGKQARHTEQAVDIFPRTQKLWKRQEREQERMRLRCTELYREPETDNWRCRRGGARKRREMSNKQDKYY